MPAYVLLTRLASDAIVDPDDMSDFNNKIKKRVQSECTGVEWTAGYVLLGQYDALDIFTAPDNETASRVALIVRSFGHAITEVLPATAWTDLEKVVGSAQASEDEVDESGENLNQGVAPEESKVGIGGSVVDHDEAEEAIEDEVDESMVESFPASDPPSFTPGHAE